MGSEIETIFSDRFFRSARNYGIFEQKMRFLGKCNTKSVGLIYINV